jgi:hypothetical protein
MAREPSRLAVDLLEAPKELVQTALDLELAEGTDVADFPILKSIILST